MVLSLAYRMVLSLERLHTNTCGNILGEAKKKKKIDIDGICLAQLKKLEQFRCTSSPKLTHSHKDIKSP